MKRQGKKLTQNYWNSLEERTRAHAVKVAMPDMSKSFAESLVREKVNMKSPWFKLIFQLVRQPDKDCGYKFVVNGVYYN